MTDEATVEPQPQPQRHPGGRPSKYEQRFCDEVESCMGEGYSLTAFAGLIGVSRSRINEWMAAHEEFREAVSRAKARRLLHWEGAALNVSKRGGGPGTATVIVFGLKNMGADEWSETTKHEHTGKDGGAIQTDNTFRLEFVEGGSADPSDPSGV